VPRLIGYLSMTRAACLSSKIESSVRWTMNDAPRRKPRTRTIPEPPRSLGSILDEAARQRGVARSDLAKGVEQAMLAAVERAFGPYRQIEVAFNEETGEIDLYQYKTVVLVVNDSDREISLEAVEKQGDFGGTEVGDDLGFQIFWRPEDAEAARVHERAFGGLMSPVREEHLAVLRQEYERQRAALSRLAAER
jgi:hypothetical protein